MPDKPYTQRIPKCEWNLHKPTIHRLYVLEDLPLTASGGVKDIMSTEYHFSATKAQYENRVKKWGFSKYGPSSNRRNRVLIGQEGRAEAQQTGPHTKHHGNTLTVEAYPIRLNNATNSLSSYRSAPRCAPLGPASTAHASSASLEEMHDISSASAPGDICLTTSSHHTGVDLVFSRDHMSASGASPGADDVFDSAWLPYTNWNAAPRHSGKPLASSFATLIMPVILRLPKFGSLGTMISFEDSSAFEAIFRNILHEGSFQLVRQQSIDRQIMYMIFHRLVNDSNVAQALIDSKTKLDRFLREGITYCLSLGNEVLTSIINATPSPYNLAFIQNMFCAALILGNGSVLSMIISMDRENFVGRPITLGYAQYYPLEYTSLKGYLQATQVLLDFGADPNQHKSRYHISNIATRLPSGQQEDADSLQILRLLFDYGLKLDGDSITHIFEDCGQNELSLLATHCLDMSFDMFFRKNALPCILWRKDLDKSFLEILEALLNRASSASTGHGDLWSKVLSTSLYIAVLRSHALAFDLLLAKGAIPDDTCLTSAVRSNDLKLLVELLDRGLDPNAEVEVLDDHEYLHTYHGEICTALGEAIKNRSKGALEILQARGYISKLAHQPAGFVPAFVAACWVGDSRLMKLLLRLQSSPRRLENIEQALEAAVEQNQHHIIEELLSLGFKPSLICLKKAIQNKQLESVKLVASCIDQPISPKGNHDILFGALTWGNQTAIDYVLRIGYPVNVLSGISDRRFTFEESSYTWELNFPPPGGASWHLTPLSAAILERNSTAVNMLIACGARLVVPYRASSGIPDRWVLTPLAAAAYMENLPLVEQFLRMGADPFDNSALFVCVMRNFANVITLLLSAFRGRYPNGVNSFGSEALYQAIRLEHTHLLEPIAKDTDITSLICEVDAYGQPLYPESKTSSFGEVVRLCCRSDDTDRLLDTFLPLMKDQNAVIRNDGKLGVMTGLLYAISLNSLKVFQKLHQAGANISLPAEWLIPRTPLQAAVQAQNKDIMEYLLGHGVSPNEPPAVRAGATALQLAAITGNINIATILLKAGANINAPPAFFDGRTAFEGATEHGRIEMMVFLVGQGADLLADGNTQYRRAVAFAEDNLQHAAKAVADELYAKAFASQGPSFIDMGEPWAEAEMPDFGTLFP